MIWWFLIVGGFLAGGIMFSYLLPKAVMGKDVCALSEDHNPGAANVFLNCGIPMGMCCLALDMAKGYFPVSLGIRLADYNCLLFTLVMIAPVMAHAMAPFNRFSGGKCIATIFGEMLALLPVTPVGLGALALLYILFSTLIKICPNSRRSIVTFTLFGCISSVMLLKGHMPTIAAGCFAVSLIAIVKHSNKKDVFFPEEETPEKMKQPTR